jgi:hypothetical protein
MTDVILVLALLAFFGVCVLYIRACERIMGPDDAVDAAPDVSDHFERALVDEVLPRP